MPTLDNHSHAVIVNSAQKRSRHLLLPTLFLFAAMAIAPFEADAANTCVMVTSLPPATTNWSDSSRWTLCGGGFPGQSGPGDTANIISLLGTTINVDVPLNSVTLHIDGSIPVQIASGASLTLESSSTATSGNTFTVGSGGTMGTASGANITGFQGAVHVNGGTFNGAGAIAFTGGAFTYSGGSLAGSGTINISNAGVFDGAFGAMPISATTINTSGILSDTSAANAVTLSSGATINVLSGGSFTFATDAAINGTAAEEIKINSGGSMQKTGGTSFNVIACFVKNDGTVDASTGGSGGFGFSGNGAHTGSFITGSSQPIVFAGNNSFGAGTSFSGGSPIKIAAGTQTFNAAITAGSGLKWAGGTIAGSGPLNVSSSMLFDGSISAMTLTGVMKSTAAITYAPSNINNLLTINGAAAVFETTTPGSLSIAGDFDIQASPAGAGKLRISGTANVNKTGGTAGSAIFAYVDNQASTIANSASGPLNIAGGGQSTGSVSVPSPGNVINFTGGTFDSSGIFSGNGNVNVSGGTLNVNTATTFSSTPTLGISAGTLAGSGAITLTGPTTWSGGTISGSSSFTISPATGVLTLTGATGPMTLDGRTITNNSSLLYNAGANNLTLTNSASIVNGSTFTASGSGTIATDGSATSITNNGTFNKTLSGLFIIAPAFNNAGSGVSITGGVLDIDATGISSAPWTMSAGTEVWFPTPFAGTYTWASGTAFAGGKVTIDGSGTVATSFPMTINNTNLEVNGGTFRTPSTFTVTTPGTLQWTGGTLAGAGHTAISANTTFDMTTESSSRSVSGHTIDNAGNATLSATAQPPSLDSGSTFNNTGSLDIQSDGSMNTNGIGTNSFNNSGTVKKSAGGSGFRFDVPYNQSGGSTDANSASSGSTIIFNNGGSMSGGILKATQASNFVDFFNASFNVTGGSFAGPGALRINGGILNVNTPFTFPSLFKETAGSLGGTSTVTIPSAASFNWSGGTITGSSGVPITIQSGGAMNADTTTSSLIYDTRPLVINSGGNVNWNSGANAIIFQSGAPVSEFGTFSVGTANGTLGNATAGSFSVTGLFRHTGAGTLNVTLPMSVQSGGTLESSGGSTLALLSTVGGTHTGTFDAQSNSFIDFSAGTHLLNGGAGFSAGTGVYKVLGAFVSLGTNVSAPNVALVSGSIAGTGDLTTTSTFSWSGGQMFGSGTTNVASGTASFTGGPLSLNRPMVLSGNTTMNAPSGLFVQATAAITNNGTFTVQSGDVQCTLCTTASFTNNGTIQKTLANTTNWSVPITGSGNLAASGGLGSLFSIQASANITSITINGSEVGFSGSTVAIGSVSGSGTVADLGVGAGNTTVSGSVTLSGGNGSLVVDGSGTMTLNGATSVDAVLIGGGTLTGSGAIVTNGNSSWNGGAITGTAPLTVNASLNIGGVFGPMTLGRNIINNALITYDAGTPANFLTVNAPASITNNGQFLIINVDDLAATGSPSLINSATGTIIRTSGPATAINFGLAISNAGTTNWTVGTTTFTNGFSQSAGTTTLNGATIGAPSAFNFTGGTFNARGTVNGSVAINGGTLNPGTSPGAVTINGDYTQSSAGILNVELNGTVAGTSYDQVNVSGNVNLNGTLNASVGFTPSNNDVFDVLTFAGTRAGDFSTYNLLPFSGGSLQSAYVSGTPNKLRLTAVVTQFADLSVTNTASSNPVNSGSPLSFVLNAANSGPNATSGMLTIANTFPAGVTSFTFSGPGWTCGALSGGVATCSTTTLIAPSSSAPPLTLSMTAPGSGPAVDSATVSSGTADPNNANNTASQSVTIVAQADLSITKSGPPSAAAGFPFVYTITVTNNGPSDAAAVVVNDPTPAGTTFVSNSGACTTPFPCALGTLTAGQTRTITTTFTTPSTFTGSSIANTASVTSTTSDPSAGNNSATVTTPFGPPNADLVLVKSGPASAAPGSTVVYTLTVVNNGPASASNVSVADPTPPGLSFVSNSGACTSAFPCSLGTLTNGQSAAITATYTVTAASGTITNTAMVSTTSPDPNSGNNASNVTTQIGVNACGSQPPTLVAPANGATVTSPVTFSWSAVPGASSYKLFAAVGGASTQEIGSTGGTTLTLPLGGGSVVWFVQALGIANCTQLVSANGTFNVCGATPVISVVGTSSAGQSYTVQWSDSGVAGYELQESATEGFDDPQTFQVTGTSKAFTKSTVTPTPFFYRVRAIGACGQGPGPYSSTERIVIVPIPPISSQGPSATVDINNKHVVVQTVFIPGQGSAIPFAATTDEPWLIVTPNAGILPAAGLTLTVSADPADLPNGTFTATIIVTFPNAAKVGALDTHPPVTVPVSVSVVTPVSPTNFSTPSANSLIIPSVGHLDGINSQWRSDVRITNTSIQKINYLLRFTPAGGDATQIKQTQISIAANDTMALDDIVKNWYGVGALGDAANGVLEVRPLNTSGKGSPIADDVNVSFATIASSRTFNQSTGGTLGQYIPAIPFANFIGKVSGDARAGILSLQQIAQSSAYRTNLGIVEASGKPVSVLISVFDTAGKNLLDVPIDLKAGEQQQLNSFLATKNITLADGRIEVKVTAGDGKIIAYASVVDNKTSDPLLLTGVPLVQTPARSFVLPGVADLSTGGANWRSDLRLFNAGVDPQYVTMTLYPQTGSASSDTIARSFTVNPGEVSVLDNVLASRFGVTNIGGAMHVDTLTDANLVLTGRTYNQVDGGGTYGQYIAAVTPADGVAKGGRTLNVLQVEDSTRYRTNLGIAEVSGKPVTVEVSVFLPDAKVAPKVTIPLAANEYRQFRVLQQLGVGTAYNARVTIRVIDGEGRITAYGSVIDMQTQDPTYVPAQ